MSSIDPRSRPASIVTSSRPGADPIVLPGDARGARPSNAQSPDAAHLPPRDVSAAWLGGPSEWARKADATAQVAYAGIDFVTQLRLSAVAGTREFRKLAEQAGVDVAALGNAALQHIDDAMRTRFQQAAQAGNAPVSVTRAEEWLKEELTLLTK